MPCDGNNFENLIVSMLAAISLPAMLLHVLWRSGGDFPAGLDAFYTNGDRIEKAEVNGKN